MVNDVGWIGLRFRKPSKTSDTLYAPVPSHLVRKYKFENKRELEWIETGNGDLILRQKPIVTEIVFAEDMPDRMFIDQPEDCGVPLDMYMTDMCNWLQMAYPSLRNRAVYMYENGIRFRDANVGRDENNQYLGKDYKSVTNRFIDQSIIEHLKPETEKSVVKNEKQVAVSEIRKNGLRDLWESLSTSQKSYISFEVQKIGRAMKPVNENLTFIELTDEQMATLNPEHLSDIVKLYIARIKQ